MIGMFDSGVGGLSIANQVRRDFEREDLLYIADQKYLPYATKSTVFLQKRAEQITQFLVNKGASTIVIACNTATVATIAHLRQTFPNITFIGVEPAIKPAVSLARAGSVLVLATKSTLQSDRLKELITMHRGTTEVLLADMPRWVELVEQGDLTSEQTQDEVITSLKPFEDKNCTVVVLACTHYPFLKDSIHKALPQATIVDVVEAVSAQVKKMYVNTASEKGTLTVLTTGDSERLVKVIPNLLVGPATVQSITL